MQQKLGHKTAYLCFASLTKIVVNNGGSISTSAPSPESVGPPAPLPQGLQFVAVNTGSAFTIHITGGSYTGGKVRIFATNAVPEAGLDTFKAEAFKPILTLPAIGVNQDITAAYVKKWGTVGVGGKMAFYVQAVSAQGVKGPKVFRVALVTATAAEEASEPGETLAQAA